MGRKGVLVTGGAGFIGSHLVELLLARGFRVTVLDDLSSGRLENLPSDPALDIVIGDTADETIVDRTVAGHDCVFHLAAVASVQASIERPVQTHRSNLLGTLRLLEAVKRFGISRFIYASSAAVYGSTSDLPQREDSPTRPLTPYAIDKLASEYYLSYYHCHVGLHATAFRFFNVYGPRQHPTSPYSGVISIFTRAALSGESVTLCGDGRQTRDFVFVADVVTALAASMSWEREAEAEVLNIGRSVEVSLIELLAELEWAVGHPIGRSWAERRSGDIRRSCADTSRLGRRLPGMQFIGLRQGLAMTIGS